MRNNPIGGALTCPDLVQLRPADNGFPALFVDAAALHRMRREAVEALNALPRRGLEIGGVLVGRVEAPRDAAISITVEDFVTFDISHEFGPAYQLSGEETAGLRYRMRSAEEGRESGGVALGWWRSDTLGMPLQYRPEDEATLRMLGWTGPLLFLLFRPHSFDPFECKMHVFENDAIYPSEEFEVPFGESPQTAVANAPEAKPPARAAQGTSAPDDRSKAAPASANAPAADSPLRSPLPPRVLIPVPSIPAVIWVTLCTLLCLGLFAAVLYSLGISRSEATAAKAAVSGMTPGQDSRIQPEDALSSQAQSSQPPLVLAARRTNGEIRLSWGDSEDLSQATSAILTIRDSNAETRLALDRAGIREGGIRYAPRSGAIEVEAVFSGPNFERRGTTQVVLAADSKAPPVVRERRMPAVASRPRPFDALPIQARARPKPAVILNQPAATALEGDTAPLKDPPLLTAGRAVTPPAPDTPREAARIVDAAASPVAAAPGCKVMLQTLAYYSPRSRFGILRALGRLPLIPGGEDDAAKGDFAGPVLVDKRCPDLRDFRLVHRPETLDFLVKLDANGTVDKVEATGPQQHTAVAERARRAMEDWQFRPARLSGTSVDSEVRVTMAMSYPPRSERP